MWGKSLSHETTKIFGAYYYKREREWTSRVVKIARPSFVQFSLINRLVFFSPQSVSFDSSRSMNAAATKATTRRHQLVVGRRVLVVVVFFCVLSFVRDVFFVPSLSLFVVCADSIFRLSLFSNSNERKHSTRRRHKKKNTSVKRANALRKRVVGLRRLSKKQRQRQQQRERLRRRLRSFGRGEIFLSKRVVNRVHTRARF